MIFDPTAYGGEVAAILALDAGGQRLMPLAGSRCSSPRARAMLQGAAARRLFPHARAPEAALAGLFLYFSCWDEAHEAAQDLSTPEGAWWHGIAHRQEPDAGNATYWFRQAGAHRLFPALREWAADISIEFGPFWQPLAFIDLCERARLQPGSELDKKALLVQRAEWQLLFDFCAATVPPPAAAGPA